MRYERKYRIPLRAIAPLRDTLERCLTRDPNADPTGAYELESVYYDTPDYRLFRDSAEGEGERAKVRLRRYAAPPDAAWLEVKKRQFGAVAKRRVSLGAVPPHPAFGQLPREAIALVASHGLPTALMPVVRIAYRRFAWHSNAAPPIRVTLDTAIRASAIPGGARTSPLPEGWGILELKSGPAVPSWWQVITARFNLAEASASKYAMAIDALGAGRVFAP